MDLKRKGGSEKESVRPEGQRIEDGMERMAWRRTDQTAERPDCVWGRTWAVTPSSFSRMPVSSSRA
jgi:hypothetical protein